MKIIVQIFMIFFYGSIIVGSYQKESFDFSRSYFKLSEQEAKLPLDIFDNDCIVSSFIEKMDRNDFKKILMSKFQVPKSMYEIVLKLFGPMSQGYIIYNAVIRKGTYLGHQYVNAIANFQKLCQLHGNLYDEQYDELLTLSEKNLLRFYREFFNNPNNEQDRVAYKLKKDAWDDFIETIQERLESELEKQDQKYLDEIKDPVIRSFVATYAKAYFSCFHAKQSKLFLAVEGKEHK